MKKGFTIVEMMMVLGIIGILLGIVATAASSSIKQARIHKANTCCAVFEQGLATYYAQKGYWPGFENGIRGTRSNAEGIDGNSDTDNYVLTVDEVNKMALELIAQTKKNNPMMDISGLYVTNAKIFDPHAQKTSTGSVEYVFSGKATGLEFWDAVRGTKRTKKKWETKDMTFGYPRADGRFMPFKVVYSIPTDEMKVGKW
jgi:prepilin-type N-terminal cleavage/methylation domain-containing protein